MNDTAPARATAAPELPLAPMQRELTVRGLVLGSVLGVLFAASSVYLSVKVGLTVSASIPVAVLSIAVFRLLGRSSVLENCMVQTTGSAGESLAFGIATAIPALLFMGYDLDLLHAFLVALLGGVLGVLMMIPLRHGLVVEESATLSFPESTAGPPRAWSSAGSSSARSTSSPTRDSGSGGRSWAVCWAGSSGYRTGAW